MAYTLTLRFCDGTQREEAVATVAEAIQVLTNHQQALAGFTFNERGQNANSTS